MTNVVRTGSATPWREIPFPNSPEESLLYVCDGHQTGNAGLLAEALRADGVVRSLYYAIKAAEDAKLTRSFYGYMDGFDGELLCDPSGYLPTGEQVDRARPCIVAQVDVSEE